ncbi:MAG TPA: EAL domain-containing protein [Steroidobacteraceae bacterium]|nr:EAL domain-containing protein [Steroidobacteraceae bacterium]
MHRLLDKQLQIATTAEGQVDKDRLMALVAETYEQMDSERRGIVRSMQLMSDEASALNQELRETTAGQLQAILDHVKDAILTVDEAGDIVTINATGQRIFGFVESDVIGKPIVMLLPDADTSRIGEQLEQLAQRVEDTQTDLAPHETIGLRSSGVRFSVELAVSKTKMDRRDLYIVCLRDTSERKAAEAALRNSEARYRRLFENVVEGVYSSTREGKFVSVNPALVQMIGCKSAAELLSLSTHSLYADSVSRAHIVEVIDRDGEVLNAEFQLRRVDGSTITVVENARAVRDEHGAVVGYEGSISDITERKRAETAVLQEKDKAQVTLKSIGDAVITTDAHMRVDYLNPIAEDLTGWESREASGRPLAEIFSTLNEITRDVIENPVSRCLREGRVITVTDHIVLVNRRGQEIAIQDSAAPIRDRAGTTIGAVMVFHDVSKERRLRRALAYQASHDALTGLINRREFENRLNEALLATRNQISVTHVLLYLDLDQFKVVNDTCGHQAGDRLLKQVTGLLQTRIRSNDTIARLGGDEFGVLLQDCNAERGAAIADTLRQTIRDFRFVWQDGVVNIGASVGIVEINRDSESITSVLSAADVACYSAKDSGRNRIHMYQQGKAPERHREMQWVSRLMRAVEENRLELYYQPIVPIGSNSDPRKHYELLLRMRGEHGEIVLPAEFIPAAERYNLMPTIDRWVVQHALGALAHYRTDGDARDAYTVSINLSGNSLNDERFLEFLINELQTHDLTPGAVCFEITETAAIANLANVVHFMAELKARGCLFSLDDFGSGLSSFMYLKNLPVDFLKIDGQFIQNMTSDHVDRSMVEAIRQIGHAMGIKTIAERVDSAQILLCLASIGVDYAQGNYIAFPESVEALSRITRSTPRLLVQHRA